MQALRQQYQGSLPIISVENYLFNVEELSRKNEDVDAKLYEIEDLRANLITKHSVYDQILDVSKNKCLLNEDGCPHKLKHIMSVSLNKINFLCVIHIHDKYNELLIKSVHFQESVNSWELEHINQKLLAMELSHKNLIKHCNDMEKTLVLVNQGFEKIAMNSKLKENSEDKDLSIELEDVHSDDESSPRSKILVYSFDYFIHAYNSNCVLDLLLGSETITLSKPKICKEQSKHSTDSHTENEKKSSPAKTIERKQTVELSNALVQTVPIETCQSCKLVQTDDNSDAIDEMHRQIKLLKEEIDKKTNQLHEAMTLAQTRTEEILVLKSENVTLESKIQSLNASNSKNDRINEELQHTVNDLTKQLSDFKMKQISEINQKRDNANEENKSLLLTLKQLENDKNTIMLEYKELLKNERDEYAKSIKEMQLKIMELQSKLDR